MELEDLITDYRMARSKADSLDKKIQREERISEHLGTSKTADLNKLWDKFNKYNAIAQDLLAQIKERKSDVTLADA